MESSRVLLSRFNSKLVRLEALPANTYWSAFTSFNSKLVRLEVLWGQDTTITVLEFQFQIGAIRGHGFYLALKSDPQRFNSKLVRLEGLFHSAFINAL